MSTSQAKVLLCGDPEGHCIDPGIVRALTSYGWQIETAPIGPASLALLSTGVAEACILDAGDSAGVSFVRDLRVAMCSLPIVAALPASQAELAGPMLVAGAADVLVDAEITAPMLDRALRYGRDRARADDALRASWQRFRAMMQNCGEGIAVLDATGKVRFANDSFWKIAGYRPHELIGKYLFELAHPDDGGRARLLFEEALAAPGESVAVTFRLQHRDGQWRTLECAFSRHGDDPDLRSVIANCRDTTDQVRTNRDSRRLAAVVGRQRQQLTLLHLAVRILQGDSKPVAGLLQQVAALLPMAWPDSDRVAARVALGGEQAATPGFNGGRVGQQGRFTLADGRVGQIDIAFLDDRDVNASGPIPRDQQAMIDSVGAMIAQCGDRRHGHDQAGPETAGSPADLILDPGHDLGSTDILEPGHLWPGRWSQGGATSREASAH
jgi:PAS domain S-box-containing protein